MDNGCDFASLMEFIYYAPVTPQPMDTSTSDNETVRIEREPSFAGQTDQLEQEYDLTKYLVKGITTSDEDNTFNYNSRDFEMLHIDNLQSHETENFNTVKKDFFAKSENYSLKPELFIKEKEKVGLEKYNPEKYDKNYLDYLFPPAFTEKEGFERYNPEKYEKNYINLEKVGIERYNPEKYERNPSPQLNFLDTFDTSVNEAPSFDEDINNIINFPFDEKCGGINFDTIISLPQELTFISNPKGESKPGHRKKRTHKSDDKPEVTEWACELCLKKFSKKDSYKHHVLRHQEKLQCEICGHSCPTETELKIHHSRNHIPKEAATIFRCDNCIYTTTTKATLNAHIARIHKAKKYSCDQCLKPFALKSDLKTHLKFHNK